MNYSTLTLHNIYKISIQRREDSIVSDPYGVSRHHTLVQITLTDTKETSFTLTAFSKDHEDFLSAGKELVLDKPIFIENYDSITNVFTPPIIHSNGNHKTEDTPF